MMGAIEWRGIGEHTATAKVPCRLSAPSGKCDILIPFIGRVGSGARRMSVQVKGPIDCSQVEKFSPRRAEPLSRPITVVSTAQLTCPSPSTAKWYTLQCSQIDKED